MNEVSDPSISEKPIKVTVNFLGRFLFGIRDVELHRQSINLSSRNKSERISIDQICNLAMPTYGFFNSSLSLELDEKTFKIQFLRKNELTDLADGINQLLVARLDERIRNLHEVFVASTEREYLRDSKVEGLSAAIEEIHSSYAASQALWKQYLSTAALSQLAKITKHRPLKNHVEQIRTEYEDRTLREKATFLDKVEGSQLTNQQRLAVIRNNDRNLVLAAAGTGKTSVMVAKALHLIESGQAKAPEILLIAYNRSAAQELQERIATRAQSIGINAAKLPKIKTFHAMGKEILQASGVDAQVSVFQEDKTKFNIWTTEWLDRYIQSSGKALQDFLTILYAPTDPFDFKTKEEYEAHVRDNEFRTLRGELVKGYQELLIANWLFLNSIEYEYEPRYGIKRRIEIGIDYRPDFQITAREGLYLEHFGIDRDRKTRPGIDAEKYNREMELKRQLHEEQGNPSHGDLSLRLV